MEVDAIQAKGKGGKKGGKDGKPTCKTCGKQHHGECWAKGQQGKGKTQQGKGKGDGKSQGKGKGKGDKSRSSSPEKCQICGKNNHNAQNCFQRYKGSVQQAAEKPGPTGQPSPAPPAQAEASGSSNRVAAVEERERSTSAETELLRTTMGISSANQQGQARCLLDTGADEHICPASFASWIKPESRNSGPRLRDAQGKVMQHGNNYRKTMLCVKTVEGRELNVPVTFLIGPVQQPIISMGRLEDDLKATLDTKRRLLEVGGHKVDVDRVMRSYHLPVWLDKPKAEEQLEQIRQVKRLVTEGDLVTFKAKPKPAEPPRPSTPRPAKDDRPHGDRERTRGRSRRRRRRDESSEPVAGPARPAKVHRQATPVRLHERLDRPKSPMRPPEPRRAKDLDVQFFGRQSRRMRAVLESENWPSAGPQYLGQDGLPITFKLYYGQRLQGETKESRKIDRTVCECGKVLKPTEASLWSHLSQKHCVPDAIWNVWNMEYKVRKDESPPSQPTREAPPSPRSARGRAPTPAPKVTREVTEPRETRASRAEAEPEELSHTPAHDNADFGLESSSESDLRYRRNRSPTPADDSSQEDVPVEEEEPAGTTVRKKRADMSAEEKKRDNYQAREDKRKRKAAAKERQGKGAQGKGPSRKRRGAVRVVQFDGWIQASGVEADEDPPEDEEIRFCDDEELQEPRLPQAPEAAGAQPDVVPVEAAEEADGDPPAGGAADRPVDLGPNPKVKDLKKRLKELHAPVWGSKEILWERLKEYEARLKSSREIAEELQRREEAINRDPESARVPGDLPVPSPPTEVQRELHNLTHLPFASWCEVCLRSRTRDNPHRSMPKEEEATRVAGPTLPLVSMDWFEIKGSPTDERPEGEAEHGFIQCLLVTDAQTGYVAAIPVPEKKNQATYACEMVVKFLKLMRHTQFRLRADNEPALNLVVEAIKGVWPHWIRVDQAPLYSSASNGKAERAIQTVRRLAVTYRLAVEQRYGCRLNSTMTMWPWLVRHAAWSHNRFHVKINYRTPYEELFQCRYQHEVVPFGETLLFMEPMPQHRRKRGGQRHQKMDAVMNRGIWLGRAEESDEHLVATLAGVYRCRTIRRLLPDQRSDKELLVGLKGVPWDLSAGAVPRARLERQKVRFAFPAHEVVERDGVLEAPARNGAEEVPEPPAPEGEEAAAEPEVGGGAGPLPARSEPLAAPSSPRVPGVVRQPEEAEESRNKRPAVEPPRGEKRTAEVPLEDIDPQNPNAGGSVLAATTEVRAEHVDEDATLVPIETLDLLDDTDLSGVKSTDHPDNWSDERWHKESLKGKAKELASLDKYQVFVPVPKAETKGKKYITTRWEEVPKFKDGQWIVRSRFVAREFRWKDPGRDDLFGVTTSANTGRILDVLLAKGPGYTAVTGDVTCAFFHAEEEEEVYVDPPTEWKDANGHEWAWKLEKQLYGRRPAPRKFSDKVASVMCQELKMLRCQEVPHLYFHPIKKVAVEVHVDDFYAVGPGNAPWEVMTELKKFLTLSLEGPFSAGESFVHLKRKRVITEDGVWIAPSDSHLKKLLELTGLNWKSTGRETPQTKDLSGTEGSPLSAEDSTLCRSIIGILMYLANDRPDIQFTVNELAGTMSKPTKESLEVAKHLTRYLLRTREYGLFFTRSWEDTDDLVVWSDSDWAGDKKTRKSRTAAHLMWGGCLLYSYTRRQTVVAQSSAEAEMYATASGVSEGILLRKVLEFVGHTVGLRAITDSSANNAVSHRLGVGKIRHLETKVLWLQDLVYDGRLVMSWIKGQLNQADLGTKVLQKKRIEELCGMIGLGPISTGKVRSVSLDPQSWKSIPVGRIVALATVLSQVPLGQGTEVAEVGVTYQYPLVVSTRFQEQGWTIHPLYLLSLAWIASVLLCGWILSCFCRREKLVCQPVDVCYYKAPTSKVVHLKKACRSLKNCKNVEEWRMCSFCI